MSDNPFYRLAPFIQEYIYRHRWDELRDIQVRAIEVILDRPDHLILAAGTASGKTEAAFLPILSDLCANPPSTVGVLYIGPTKALINDQFYRLQGLLEEADIPVWAWHGDVGASQKKKLLQSPAGVLQITPESLESLLINKVGLLPKIFGDLRYIVLDEVHIFMNSDRGRQVLCQLERLERFTTAPPRRVGLSATLGDKIGPEQWLVANTNISAITIKDEGGKNKIKLGIEHFTEDPDNTLSNAEADTENFFPHDLYVYELTQARTKSLIFANSRGKTESIIATLRQIAFKSSDPDIYHVHHGSIAAPLREAAEQAMKAEHRNAVTAATLTLELGIDIGQLERVIQLGSPFSVASFLQRLGRSGRRGDLPEIFFVFREDAPTGKEMPGKQFPWHLLQSIAIIQLYAEEKWIEPIAQVNYPWSMLYHQTMSVLAGSGELSAADLARRVLNLAPFKRISLDDYRTLLRHLISIDHLEQMPTGGLIIGLAGEKIVRNYRFYAVFQENIEYSVRGDEGEIGRIMMLLPIGERFMLAGRTWTVIDVAEKQRVIYVKRVAGRANTAFLGGGGDIHQQIIDKVREILFSNTDYSYLRPNARNRLVEARQLAQTLALRDSALIPLSESTFCLFPWLGSRQFETLKRYLIHATNGEVIVPNEYSPYYLEIQCSAGQDRLNQILNSIDWSRVDRAQLIGKNEWLEVNKFDEFIPQPLLHRAYLKDYLVFPI